MVGKTKECLLETERELGGRKTNMVGGNGRRGKKIFLCLNGYVRAAAGAL